MKRYEGYSDEELKEEIRKDLAKERKEKAEAIRHKRLRAEVEVEELWNIYDPKKQYRENLEQWLNEWCNGSYETYLDDIDRFRAPSVSVQCQHSPDLYERHQEEYSIYGYRSKSNAKDRKTDALAIGIVAACIVLFGVVIYWLV